MSQNKKKLHPRNLHNDGYPFADLIKSCPELKEYVYRGKSERLTIDFSNQQALKLLNKALLIHYYGIRYWDIPEGYLCPAVPSRADYLHNVADLLSSSQSGKIPTGKSIKVLDIGTGANCIYPIIGHRQYGWHFVGTDIDEVAVRAARAIIEANPNLRGAISIRQQNQPDSIFKGVVKPKERFDLCICNPPFFDSSEQASKASSDKWKKLGIKMEQANYRNFGGQRNELETKGGEVGFITRMIEESKEFGNNFKWFSTLVSKRNSLPFIHKILRKMEVGESRGIELERGQKKSRIVAWNFLG